MSIQPAGSSAAYAHERRYPSGVYPSALAFDSLITMSALAPSVRADEFPAVTVPYFLSKAGRSFSYDESSLSWRTRLSSAIGLSNEGPGTTCMTSSAKSPAFHAAEAFEWLLWANASWAARVMPASRAIFSALSPMVSPVVGSLIAGGTGTRSRGESFEKMRSLSARVLALLASTSAPASLRDTVMGTSVDESAPPQIAAVDCPARIDSAALVSAWKLVAQARLTLNASMFLGRPVPSTTSRAMLGAETLGTTWPYTQRSMIFGSISLLWTSSRTTMRARSWAERSRYAEACLANGVRSPATMARRSRRGVPMAGARLEPPLGSSARFGPSAPEPLAAWAGFGAAAATETLALARPPDPFDRLCFFDMRALSLVGPPGPPTDGGE